MSTLRVATQVTLRQPMETFAAPSMPGRSQPSGFGTAASAIGKGQQVQIASETKLDFTLQQDVSITYNPDKVRSTR